MRSNFPANKEQWQTKLKLYFLKLSEFEYGFSDRWRKILTLWVGIFFQLY